MSAEVENTTIPESLTLVSYLLGFVGGRWRKFDSQRFRERLPIIVTTGTRAVLASESGSVLSNYGAAGAVMFTLPPATPGLNYYAAVMAAQQLQIDPDGSEVMCLPSATISTPQTGGKYIWADAVGERVHLSCVVAGRWDVLSAAGTWTAV